jgi:hypothetical protein
MYTSIYIWEAQVCIHVCKVICARHEYNPNPNFRTFVRVSLRFEVYVVGFMFLARFSHRRLNHDLRLQSDFTICCLPTGHRNDDGPGSDLEIITNHPQHILIANTEMESRGRHPVVQQIKTIRL